MSVLGPVEADGGAGLEPRDRAVLAVLTVSRGQVVTSAQIADAVWADSAPGTWPKQVQICIGRLRKVLGPGAIETAGGGYRLVLPDDDVDARRFEQLVERGRALLAVGEPDRAAATIGRGLDLWRGPPLDELDGWLPARSEAARLEELRRSAEEDWLDARLAAGGQRGVAAEAEALVAAEPLRERRWMILALAQYRCARQGDALRTLARARQVLVEQLGVSPGPDLVELEGAILRQDPGLEAIVEPAELSNDCPYRGLAPFDESDADAFYGRAAETAACLDRLRLHPFLVVAGPSGCGKSSLVRAGVVPALRRRGHDVLVAVPGTDPQATANEIRAADDVVVLDQLEELFVPDRARDAVDDLCAALVAHVEAGGLIVVVIRSDRLGELSGDRELSRLVERGLHLVSSLAGDALREAIEQPAVAAGLRLEHGLVELLVRDCEGEPGGLPLLSHALVETWRRRDGATLTVEGYRASGGIRGAVARSADRLHDGLTADERAVLRSVLLRLVSPSLEGDPLRCRVPSRVLRGDPQRERVLGLLVRARLVTAEEDSFEVAHEALARAWPRLRSWLDEDVAGQRILRHLTAAADGWDSLRRPDSELYRGARLDTALEWRDRTEPQLTELEQSFLTASELHDQSERRRLEARAVEDARTKRRLRRLLVASTVLVVAALVAGLVAVRQADRADTERELADVRELAATASADVDIDPERSALLALAALDRAGPDLDAVRQDIEQALHDALAELRLERRLADAGRAVDWSFDGRSVLTIGRDTGDVEVREAGTGRVTMTLPLDAAEAVDSPDGDLIAVSSGDGSLRVLTARTGAVRSEVDGAGVPLDPTFTPAGDVVAAAWRDDRGGVVRLIDAANGIVVDEISWPGVLALTFSPDGKQVAVISSSSGAVLDVADGRQVARLESRLGPLTDVAWSPDGRLLAVSLGTGSAQIHDADTGRGVTVLPGHKAWVNAVAWSPDSSLLATASSDGTTKVWSLTEGGGRELMTLTADDTRNGFGDVAFSPDGTRIVTGAFGGTAIVWRIGIDATSEVATLPGAAFGQGDAQFTADGRLLATSGEGNIAVWDVDTWQRDRTIGIDGTKGSSSLLGLPPHSPSDPIGLAPSPDAQLVAAVSDEQWQGVNPVLTVHAVDGGPDGFRVDLGGWVVASVSWSQDGQLVAVSGGDRDDVATVVIADRRGEILSTRRFPDRFVETAQFTFDDEHLVIAHSTSGSFVPGTGRVEVWGWREDEVVNTIDVDAWYAVPHPRQPLVAIGPRDEAADQSIAIWDYETGERVVTLSGHTGVVNDLAFSPDGSRLATANGDGSIRIYDTASGQQQLELRGHAGLVANVSFSPDGRWLASYGAEGTVRVWTLDIDELAAIARERVTRGLTEAECERYLRTACPPAE